MAIARMHKMRIVTLKKYREFIYSVLQSMQVVEPKEVANQFGEDISYEEIEEKIKDSMAKDDELLRVDTIHSNVTNALTFLKRHVPEKSFREKNSVDIPVYTLEELDNQVESLNVQSLVRELHIIRDQLVDIDTEIEELYEKEDFLIRWNKLKITPQDIEDFKHIGVIVGTVPQTADNQHVDAVKEFDNLVVEEVLHSDDVYGFVGYFQKDERDLVYEKLREQRFDRLSYPYDRVPSEEVEVTRQRIKDLKAEKKEIKNKLKSRQSDVDRLELASEYYYAKSERLKAAHLAMETDNIFTIEGWVEVENTDEMEAFVYENIPQDEVFIEYEDILEEEIDDVPIKLNNNAINAPFETVTKMYALPKYNEMDPTPWVSPFYMLFFGMMLADLGYGLLLWIGTFFMLRFMNLKPGMEKNIKFFHILSYPTMIVGLIYGSLFGVTIPTQIISINDQAIEVLLASMAIGILHLILALALNVYLNFKHKMYIEGIKDGLAWIAVLIGAILAAVGGLVFSSDAMLQAGLITIGVAFIVVVVGSIMTSDSKGAGLAWGLYDVYGVSGYIGDIVSYSRLMALGMSGGSIAAAFNMLVGMLPIWLRFTVGIVLIIGLQLFNLFLSALSAYVHGLRLIFVEFFGKFYDGGGREFKPLKGKEDYIRIEQKKNYTQV